MDEPADILQFVHETRGELYIEDGELRYRGNLQMLGEEGRVALKAHRDELTVAVERLSVLANDAHAGLLPLNARVEIWPGSFVDDPATAVLRMLAEADDITIPRLTRRAHYERLVALADWWALEKGRRNGEDIRP